MYHQSLRTTALDPSLWAFSWRQQSRALGFITAPEGKKISKKLKASSELIQPRGANTVVRPLPPLPELTFGGTAYQQRPLGSSAGHQASPC